MIKNLEVGMKNIKLLEMNFNKIYPLYVSKAEKKSRSEAEVREIIIWLTGYDEEALDSQLRTNKTVEEFFNNAPKINEKAFLIKGLICGYRMEDIEEGVIKNIRQLDKLIDELARGKSMDKILRK